ncbi:GAF domain-containing protein [bacterium]|nr:GAF domain-containing protein [bacterium]
MSIEWNFYTQGSLAAVVITIFLIVAVLRNNFRRTLNQTYVYPSLFFLFWNTMVLIDKIVLVSMNLETMVQATFFFIPVGTFHFLLVFLRTQSRQDWLFLKCMYLFSSLSFFIFLQLEPGLNWPRYLLAVYALPFLGRGFMILYQHFKRSVSLVERYQIVYLTLGIVLWLAGAVAEFFRFPGFAIYPVSSFCGLAFFAIAAWSIIRLRLADISVLTGKILVYLSFVLLFSLLYVLFSQSWPDTPFGQMLKVVFSVVLLLVIYEPITRRVEEWGARILLKESFQLISLLKELHRSLATMIDSTQVFRKFMQIISKAEKIATASLFMQESSEGDYYPFHSPFFPVGRLTRIEKDKPIIEFLEEKHQIIVRDEIERELQMTLPPSRKKKLLAVYRTMTVLEADICVPIIFQNQVRGFIALRSSELTSLFNRREKELLTLLADQMGIITENARLYTLMKKQDRLAAIGQMSTGLAHEIRNPLGALKAVAQHLESAQTEPELKEFLSIIIEEVNRLNDVVVRFLSFAHPLKLELNEVDLNSLIEKTVAFLKNESSWDSVHLILELEPDLPHLALDEVQIRQVLLNLIINARQAINGTGQITIQTSLMREQRSSRIKESVRDSQATERVEAVWSEQDDSEPTNAYTRPIVELSIEDTGQGIPEEHLDKIFTPFFTTKEGGSGLGLSIAHRIIESHGAEIEAHSHPGHGSRFVLRFFNTINPIHISPKRT